MEKPAPATPLGPPEKPPTGIPEAFVNAVAMQQAATSGKPSPGQPVPAASDPKDGRSAKHPKNAKTEKNVLPATRWPDVEIVCDFMNTYNKKDFLIALDGDDAKKVVAARKLKTGDRVTLIEVDSKQRMKATLKLMPEDPAIPDDKKTLVAYAHLATITAAPRKYMRIPGEKHENT